MRNVFVLVLLSSQKDKDAGSHGVLATLGPRAASILVLRGLLLRLPSTLPLPPDLMQKSYCLARPILLPNPTNSNASRPRRPNLWISVFFQKATANQNRSTFSKQSILLRYANSVQLQSMYTTLRSCGPITGNRFEPSWP